MKIKTDVYCWSFGIIIPQKTGILWEQQTCGCLCSHIQIEGTYIPLSKPYAERNQLDENLLDKLQEANYNHSRKLVGKLWRSIKKEMIFKFEETTEPKNQPCNQEGLQWIKITGLKREVGSYRTSSRDFAIMMKDFGGLIGKTVALIYPNSD